MSRSNKGIRDIVKDTRVGSSEVRPPSSSGSQPLSGLPYVMNSSKMQKQYSGLSQSMIGGGTNLKQSMILNVGGVADEYAGLGGGSKQMGRPSDEKVVMSDLRVATDKFFGQGSENFFPEIKDKTTLTEMRRMIEEQRKELEARNTTIQALQRNFESLSTLCLNERSEKSNLTKMCDQLKTENKEQAQQLVNTLDQVDHCKKEIAALNLDKKKLEKIRDEHTVLKDQHQQLKQTLEMRNDRISKLEAEVQQLKQQITDLKFKITNLESQLKDQEKIKDNLRFHIKELEDEIKGQDGEVKRMNMVIFDKDQMIQTLGQQIEEAKGRFSELNERFAKKDKQHRELEADHEKEKTKRRELEKAMKELKALDYDIYIQFAYSNSAILFALYEYSQTLVKTGEMSQDELRKRVNELQKKLTQCETDLKAEIEQTDILSEDLLEQKELFAKTVGQLQKEASHYKDTISKFEIKMKQRDEEKETMQHVIRQLQDQKFELEDEIKQLGPVLGVKEKQIEDLNLLKEQNDSERAVQREEYLRAFNKMREEIQTLRAGTKSKDDELEFFKVKLEEKESENLQMSNQVTELQDKLQAILEQNSDISSLQEKCAMQDLHIKEMEAELGEQRARNDELERDKAQMRAEAEELRRSSGSFEESLSRLKRQVQDDERVIANLTKDKSDMNSKLQQAAKDSRALESEVSRLRFEIKELQEQIGNADKSNDTTYQRLQDAVLKIAKLEKDAELQQEVLSKRHDEMSSLLKENTRYKNELDEIRRAFGDMTEIETRIKVATLKEEKINGLLSQLDQIMKSTESNLSCYTCMQMMTDPTILVPCGHAFCKKCIGDGDTCAQCEKKFKSSAPVKLIADLVTKYIYKRDAINTFKNDSFWKGKVTGE